MSHIRVFRKPVTIGVGGGAERQSLVHRRDIPFHKFHVPAGLKILTHKNHKERSRVGSVIVNRTARGRLVIDLAVKPLVPYEILKHVTDRLEISHLKESQRTPFSVTSKKPGVPGPSAHFLTAIPATPR